MPAASSMSLRRSCGLPERMRPILPCSMTEYARTPRPVSISRSLTSFRRVTRPFRRYWLSPPGNTRRPMVRRPSSEPGKEASVRRVSMQSAIPSGLRESEPLKMTSSMVPPRRLLALCSPSTQVMASMRLLLPQPLGPTMAVTPPATMLLAGFLLPLLGLAATAYLLGRLATRRLVFAGRLERGAVSLTLGLAIASHLLLLLGFGGLLR